MNRNTMSGKSFAFRACSLLLALVLLLPLLPAQRAAAADEKYGYVNHDEVRFRRETGSTVVWARLDTGWVCRLEGTKTSGGVTYYKVVTGTPGHPERDYTGFISQQYVTEMTQEQVDAWVAQGRQQPYAALPGALPGGATKKPSDTPKPDDANPPQVTQTPGSQAPVYTNFARPNNASTNYYTYNGATLTSLGLLSATDAYYVNRTETIGGTAYYVILVNGVERHVKASNMTMLTQQDIAGGTMPTQAPATQVPATQAPGTQQPGTAAPGGTGTPLGPVIGYVRITPKGSTNIRRTPKTHANNRLAHCEQGDILPYYSTTVEDGEAWYYVYYAPENVYGYVLDECCERVGDPQGNTLPPATPTPTPTQAPATATPPGGYAGFVVLTHGGVNLRKDATKRSSSLGRFDKGEVFVCTGTKYVDGVTWYQVITEKHTGYFHGDFCKPSDAKGDAVITTPDPGGAPNVSQGYLYTTKDKVYLRKKATTDGGYHTQIKNKETVLPIMGPTVKSGSYYWYYVLYEGDYGYMRSDCVAVMSAEQIAAYLAGQGIPDPTPAPTPLPKADQIITTILDNVWLRKSPSKSAGTYGQIRLGTVLRYKSGITVAGQMWYRVEIDGNECYILGSCVRVMNDLEYAQYLAAQPSPTPSPSPTPKPDPSTLSNIALTRMEKVIVRAEGNANAKQLTLLYRAGYKCELLGRTVESGGYTWYNLKASGMTGWVRGDLIRVLTKTEAEAYEQMGDPDVKPEASYSTLSEGSTGDAVIALQTRLAQLGYLSQNDITGSYGSVTKNAVKEYQSDYGLTVDGIAGSLTQHSLYGTVETGYYGGEESSTKVQLYKPELIDWYSGGIQSIFYRGAVATVTDVKTGISYKVKRWAGAYHADVEPLTAKDTAAMCKIYGTKTAQEISDKDLWQRRSVLVTISGHSYCASMYGVPHNYPDGDTIDDNDFYGQFCLHFINSRTHAGNKVDSDHQKAIMYAYQNAATLLKIK